MSTRALKRQHEAFYQEVAALRRKHTGEVPAIELLAGAANVVGKLVALDDQRTLAPEIALKTVAPTTYERATSRNCIRSSSLRGRYEH